MKYAVLECYHAIKLILTEVLVGEGRMWYVPGSLHMVLFCLMRSVMQYIIYGNLNFTDQKEVHEKNLEHKLWSILKLKRKKGGKLFK